MTHLSLHMLGSFLVALDSGAPVRFSYSKLPALLAYLVLEADRPHHRESLAEVFWPERAPSVARDNLRAALSSLRKVVGDSGVGTPLLWITRDTIQFNSASQHWLDVTAFNELVQACARHSHAHPEACPLCRERLREAVALYRGDLLTNVLVSDSEAYWEWLLAKREGLRRRALKALYLLAAGAERLGAYDQAEQYARRQLELEPWREEAHRQLMRALALSGERSAALAHYETCRRILATELGVEPDPETVTLHQRLRAGSGVIGVGWSETLTPYGNPQFGKTAN